MAEFNRAEQFDNMLRTLKPPNFDALIQSMKTKPKDHREGSMQHFHCEYLKVWSDEADILSFMRSETNMNDSVDRIVGATHILGMQAKIFEQNVLKRGQMPIFLCYCLGCNTPYDNNEDHSHYGSPQKCKIADFMPKEVGEQAELNLHQALCHLSGAISLLTWTPSEDKDSFIKEALAERQDYLINLLIDPRPLCGVPQLTLCTPLASLVGLIDNCSQCYPKCAQNAVTLLSLVVSNRPSRCLSQLDPEFILPAMKNFFRTIFPRVSNAQCIVEEYFGITQILNAIPLLYYLGD
jgi:hypothetical protein